MIHSSGNNQVRVIGAGGHAKVVIATLSACGYRVSGLYDDNIDLMGRSLFGIPILGTLEAIKTNDGYGLVIAIGTNRVRKRIYERFPDAKWIKAIHPSSVVHESVILGPGSVVFAGAIVQPDSKIGKHCIVNTGASVDHDCVIEDYVHMAPGCHLAGSVQIGEGAFMGMGSSAIPGIHIGNWSIVGAGAVVINDLPKEITAVGIPARVLKK